MTEPSGLLSLDDFVDSGLLQEVNRQFFHPRGLALEVSPGDSPTRFVARVWDERSDPDGMRYADGVINPSKADNAAAMIRNEPQPVPSG